MLCFSGLADGPYAGDAADFRITHSPGSVSVSYDGPASYLYMEVDVRARAGSPTMRVRRALWDCGARMSCVADGLAAELGLRPVGTGVISGVSGMAESAVYELDLDLGGGMAVPGLRVLSFPGLNSRAEFLIGMDVISRGALAVDSSGGRTVLTFCMR